MAEGQKRSEPGVGSGAAATEVDTSCVICMCAIHMYIHLHAYMHGALLCAHVAATNLRAKPGEGNEDDEMVTRCRWRTR